MKMFVVREGLFYAGVFALAGLLLSTYNTVLSVIVLLCSVVLLYFFRDPERNISHVGDFVLSPADGKVLEIKKVQYNNLLESAGTKIGIFLSPFDVHINRSPIEGQIKYTEYQRGSKLPAFLDRASRRNERNTIVIEGKIRVVLTQIAGFIGRRIVLWKKEGDIIALGEKIGLIRFGSRTEIILPENVVVLVKVGDKVKAGETLLGEINE